MKDFLVNYVINQKPKPTNPDEFSLYCDILSDYNYQNYIVSEDPEILGLVQSLIEKGYLKQVAEKPFSVVPEVKIPDIKTVFGELTLAISKNDEFNKILDKMELLKVLFIEAKNFNLPIPDLDNIPLLETENYLILLRKNVIHKA